MPSLSTGGEDFMKDERQIVIEYGSGSPEELLDIAAAGIAAMLFAKQQSSKQSEKNESGII